MDSFREHVGCVEQEPRLFNTTIKDNVTYGLHNCPEVCFLTIVPLPFYSLSPTSVLRMQQKIASSLDAANCTEFVTQMSDGTATIVGDMGSRLSGGQVPPCPQSLRSLPSILSILSILSIHFPPRSPYSIRLTRSGSVWPVLACLHARTPSRSSFSMRSPSRSLPHYPAPFPHPPSRSLCHSPLLLL